MRAASSDSESESTRMMSMFVRSRFRFSLDSRAVWSSFWFSDNVDDGILSFCDTAAEEDENDEIAPAEFDVATAAVVMALCCSRAVLCASRSSVFAVVTAAAPAASIFAMDNWNFFDPFAFESMEPDAPSMFQIHVRIRGKHRIEDTNRARKSDTCVPSMGYLRCCCTFGKLWIASKHGVQNDRSQSAQ